MKYEYTLITILYNRIIVLEHFFPSLRNIHFSFSLLVFLFLGSLFTAVKCSISCGYPRVIRVSQRYVHHSLSSSNVIMSALLHSLGYMRYERSELRDLVL